MKKSKSTISCKECMQSFRRSIGQVFKYTVNGFLKGLGTLVRITERRKIWIDFLLFWVLAETPQKMSNSLHKWLGICITFHQKWSLAILANVSMYMQIYVPLE